MMKKGLFQKEGGELMNKHKIRGLIYSILFVSLIICMRKKKRTTHFGGIKF